ncbi:MAG: peroxiredoxin Q/BCP [Marinoscillum sp.]|jgi:peroxiredoxin Q/BCP
MNKGLKLGDQLPDVSLKNQFGDLVTLEELKGDKAIVVYFYPKDNTPGCTAEACGFRDQWSEFESIDATVVGISNDSISSHAAFAKQHNLNFTLLSDPKKIAEQAFGVPRNLFGLVGGRMTFIFDSRGKLIKSFNSAIQIKKHIQEALTSLKSAS